MIKKLRDWFRKEALEAKLVYGSLSGRIAFPPRTLDAYITEGYNKNPVVYKCIDDIARGVASVPLLVYKGDKEVTDHPLNALLNRANPTQTFKTLLRDVVTNYLTTGNGYIEGVDAFGKVGELWSKRAQFVSIQPGQTMVAAYRYTAGTGSVSWPVDQVTGACKLLHLRTVSLTDSFFGTPPLEAAATNVDQLNEVDQWNYSTLKRGPMYRGIFTTDGTLISDEEVAELRNQLDGPKFSGSRSSGRPPILPRGLSWHNTSLAPKDMAITENKDLTARFICLAFGYPPMLLGLAQGSTFNNVAEAREYLWDNTIIPLLEFIIDELNNWLAQWYPGVRLVPDLDQVPALETRRERTWKRLETADFLTIDEKREALGYEKVQGGDRIMVSAAMMPLGEAPPDMTAVNKWLDHNMDNVVNLYGNSD